MALLDLALLRLASLDAGQPAMGASETMPDANARGGGRVNQREAGDTSP